MDKNFADGKSSLIVGFNTSNILTLKRDLLLYDGFVDEHFGKSFPDIYHDIAKDLKFDSMNENEFPFITAMREFSELCSLDLVRNFADLGISSTDLKYERLIAGIKNDLGENKNISDQLSDTFKKSNRNQWQIENEMVYRATLKIGESGTVAIPRFKEDDDVQVTTDPRATVVRVILNKFPSPDPSVSIAKILDFKHDADSIRRLGSLNVLIGRLARENAQPSDILQEIEQLLLEARSVMRAKGIAYKESKITKIIRLGEAVIKGNLGYLLKKRDHEKAESKAKSEFNLSIEDLAFMEKEISSEWKHVAYILKASAFAKSRDIL